MPNKKSIRNNATTKLQPKPTLTTEEEKKFLTLLAKRTKGLGFGTNNTQRLKELFLKTYKECYSTACPKKLANSLNSFQQQHWKRSKKPNFENLDSLN